MILGDAFLRNTYSLFNYGNFKNGTADQASEPFVQLLNVRLPLSEMPQSF